MGIKQKLLLMGVLMALLVVAICGIGYHQAQTALEESVSGEINAALTVEAGRMDVAQGAACRECRKSRRLA